MLGGSATRATSTANALRQCAVLSNLSNVNSNVQLRETSASEVSTLQQRLTGTEANLRQEVTESAETFEASLSSLQTEVQDDLGVRLTALQV